VTQFSILPKSPNGYLHLGHALSALPNEDEASKGNVMREEFNSITLMRLSAVGLIKDSAEKASDHHLIGLTKKRPIPRR
jgi:hypothetical protein